VSIHHRWIGTIIKGNPRQIIRDGVLDEAAMKKGELSHGDLQEALRLHGHESIDGIKAAYLERSGAISLVEKD
jgi:uncharacterized membrane protein YcaP (DUF421 family)